jgi:transcriptional regulator with XRE-family HTH domain
MRKAKGLTQEGLGKGLGTDGTDASKSVVYGWEKDQHYPRVDQLTLICDKLGCSADFLLFGRASATTVPTELVELAAVIEQLSPERQEWAMLTLREMTKLAREMVASENPVSAKDESAPELQPSSSSLRRKAA